MLISHRDNAELIEGEVRLADGRTLMLGTDDLDLDDGIDRILHDEIRANWELALQILGVDDTQTRRDLVMSVLGTPQQPRLLPRTDAQVASLADELAGNVTVTRQTASRHLIR